MQNDVNLGNEVIKQEEPSDIEINKEQVLTFIDDKQSESFIIPVERPVLDNFNNQGLELREHTVRDFLSRPMNIGQFTWSSSQVRNDEIFSFSFPTTLFSQGMIAEKISGFAYLRGDIHVRLQINAQNFQAGMFQLRYFPVLSPASFYNSQLNTMVQFSGLPGIDVNLQSDSPMQMTVPFIYPNDVYDIIVSPDDWAQVHARVYSPLTAASATSVSITVWAWFDKDTLDLSMPSSLTSVAVTDSLIDYYMTKKMKMVRDARLQIKGEQKKASKAGGPVSTVADAVGSIAEVASGVPFLSSIAEPVKWGASIVSSIASLFGWSKPSSNQIITQLRPIYVRGMANSDCPDSATQTALFVNNNLAEGRPVYRTDVDEMAFDFIVRVPHFITAFNYSTMDSEGTLLFSIEINPVILTTSIVTGSPNIITTTSLGLVCSCFELWRGSINLTFKFAKTQFHSGRIIFVWYNANLSSIPAPYTTDLAKNPAIQFDLHDKFEIDINIPYLQATPWLNIHSQDSTFKRNNGFMAVYVINTLQAAPSASTTIETVVECRAGADFEVAIPKSPELLGNWVVPQATKVAPSFTYIIVTAFVFNDFGNTFDFTLKMPWDASTLVFSYAMPGTLPTLTSTTVTAGYILTIAGINYVVGGGTLTFQVTSYNPGGIQILITSSVATVNVTETLNVGPGELPFNWLLMSPMRLLDANLEVSRDESVQGIDGVSILPSINSQTMGVVNDETVGEVIKSVRCLLKRYLPDTNFVNSLQFGRNFIVINPDVFSALTQISAPYISLFAPAYRFWRGSRRYKLLINAVTDTPYPADIFPFYLLPNYTSTTLSFDPNNINLSTNLHYSSNEGILEFSVPYYNRNRISIVGDVTSAALLSPMSRKIVVDLLQTGTFSPRLFSNIGEDFSFGMWLGAPTLVATPR